MRRGSCYQATAPTVQVDKLRNAISVSVYSMEVGVMTGKSRGSGFVLTEYKPFGSERCDFRFFNAETRQAFTPYHLLVAHQY